MYAKHLFHGCTWGKGYKGQNWNDWLVKSKQTKWECLIPVRGRIEAKMVSDIIQQGECHIRHLRPNTQSGIVRMPWHRGLVTHFVTADQLCNRIDFNSLTLAHSSYIHITTFTMRMIYKIGNILLYPCFFLKITNFGRDMWVINFQMS